MYLKVYDAYGKSFPQDARAQLRACIKAVFGSWNSERAIKYREINQITNLLGTACNIQTMVFGNLGNTSGTGDAFSRDPGSARGARSSRDGERSSPRDHAGAARVARR